MLDNSLDILCIGETKLADSYQDSQFYLPGYTIPYRLDGKNEHSGGIMVYINENIPSKQLKRITISSDFEVIPIEINLRKSKWLILSIYRPDWVGEIHCIECINSIIDYYEKYDNVMVLGDFNMKPCNPNLCTLMESQALHNLINSPTCFKNPKGSCIDLILTNKKHGHKFSQTFEVGFNDFHVMIYTMLKTTFTKLPPKEIKYRSSRNYDKYVFYNDLRLNLSYAANGNYNQCQQ